MFMLDDAHDLNIFQKKSVNSWIAYRDHSDYSFKVAITSEREYDFITASGGNIIEDHDFTKVERENPYRNSNSDFGQMAKEILQRRLDLYNINVLVEEFFPINSQMAHDLEQAKLKAKADALAKYETGNEKQISDYVYKHYRAHYFKSRSVKSNLPPYSGFDLIIQLSTGVIRNLLVPCHEMYEMMLSKLGEVGVVNEIESSVQTKAINKVSKDKWNSIEHLHRSIEGCTELQKDQLLHLFSNLMTLFKSRLMSNISEPRAIKFIITEQNSDSMNKLEDLLIIARKAQLLYTRSGRSKDDEKNTTYYDPNRPLLPDRGLDPTGQHASISLKSSDLWAAAYKNKPLRLDDKNGEDTLLIFQDSD